MQTINTNEEIKFDKESLLQALNSYFIMRDKKAIQNVKDGESTMDEFEEKVYTFLATSLKVPDENLIFETMNDFKKIIWGYGKIDHLIHDKDISDIKILKAGPGGIRISKKGIRSSADVCFENEKELKAFYDTVAIKNEKGTSRAQAISYFTDKKTSDLFRLRITLSSDFIVTDDTPVITIRKFPKFKRTPEELIEAGFMTSEQYNYIVNEVHQGTSINVVGRGGTWKSTLINTLLEEISDQDAISIIQENEELFVLNHPETINYHVINSSGDGRISYELSDLATLGLLQDIDTFCIGEIKGYEALDYIQTNNSGTRTIASLHAGSAELGIEKLVWLARRAINSPREDILRMMDKIGLFIYIEKQGPKRVIKEILKAEGYDSLSDSLKLERIEV